MICKTIYHNDSIPRNSDNSRNFSANCKKYKLCKSKLEIHRPPFCHIKENSKLNIKNFDHFINQNQ